MNRTRALKCVVCGTETTGHANWFLVAENRWLDHLKVLSWHPLLAEQTEMQSVCGEEHLKVLLRHWVAQANLDLEDGEKCVVPITGERQAETEIAHTAVGSFLGELAVHREPLSRGWTGSPQTLECILRALTGREVKPTALDCSLATLHAEPLEGRVYGQSAGRS